jgi:hypothetical protein
VDSGIVKLIELLVIVGAVFGFGFWQLASLRRDRRDREQKKREAGDAADAKKDDRGR